MHMRSVLIPGLLLAFGITFAAAPAVNAQQKTAKACAAEWKANKASIQASGKKKKEFMAECRAGTTATAATPPATTAPATPAPSTAAPSAQAAPAPARVPRKTVTTATPAQAGEYATEAEAKSHCPNDTVVWANTKSKIYHFAGTRDFGTTKKGAYMCERDTAAAGMRAAKNEKHP